jgi:ribosomal protein S4
LDAKNMTARMVQAPTRADIDMTVDEQLIVEYYSR